MDSLIIQKELPAEVIGKLVVEAARSAGILDTVATTLRNQGFPKYAKVCRDQHDTLIKLIKQIEPTFGG